MTIDRRSLLQIVALSSLGLATGFPGMAKAQRAPKKPNVVPALKVFTAGEGSLVLAPSCRIAARGKAAASIARTLSVDLAELSGRKVAVATGSARVGDIEVRIDPTLRHADGGKRFDEEGYRIEVSDRVVVTAPTATGAYWATRSLLQQLLGVAGRATLMRGTTHDWPDYPNRGFMLDVGRKYITPEFLRDYVSLMSWFKVNEFQVHLMDNGFLEKGSLDWSKVARGFRLKSTNPKFAGLASEDGAYDRQTWNALEDHAADRFVRLIPEIEGPAHALSVVGWKPELGLTGKNGDHLDLANPESTRVMKEIFSEFVPWFRGPDVHIGVDEYKADPELFKKYYNDIVAHVRSLGKHSRAWGSFSEMSKGVAGYDPDVTINCWNNQWYGMESAVKDGFRFINTDDSTLYVVPYADYYRGDGLDNRELYDNWNPSMAGSVKVDPAAPLGSMWAVWNDLTRRDYSELDVHQMIEMSFPVLAQKNWNADKPAMSFEAFGDVVATVGLGPARNYVKAARIGLDDDIMLGATVTASASRDGFPVSNVNDREPASYWQASGTGPATLDIDIGNTQPAFMLEIECRGDQRLSYGVQVSADGTQWRTITDTKTATSAIDYIMLPGRKFRYIRLTNVRSDVGTPSISRISLFPSANGKYVSAIY